MLCFCVSESAAQATGSFPWTHRKCLVDLGLIWVSCSCCSRSVVSAAAANIRSLNHRRRLPAVSAVTASFCFLTPQFLPGGTESDGVTRCSCEGRVSDLVVIDY